MATAKNTHTAVIYTIRASTLGAKLDACSGYNGNCDCTVLVCSLLAAAAERRTQFRIWRAHIATPENQNTRHDGKDRQNSAETKDPENGGTVAAGRRVILETVEQQMIDGIADFAGGSVHQAEPNLSRRIFHSIEIARDAPVRGKQHDSAGVREDPALLIEGVAKICGSRQRVDRLLPSRKKVPS